MLGSLVLIIYWTNMQLLASSFQARVHVTRLSN
jgi:hypothetical protein